MGQRSFGGLGDVYIIDSNGKETQLGTVQGVEINTKNDISSYYRIMNKKNRLKRYVNELIKAIRIKRLGITLCNTR